MNDEERFERDVWADLAAGEPALTLAEAAKLPCLRRDAERNQGRKCPNVCTIYRFTTRGATPAGGGSRVVLEHFQQARGRCVTASAVLRFLRRLSGDAGPRRPTAAAAAREGREARKRLARAGI